MGVARPGDEPALTAAVGQVKPALLDQLVDRTGDPAFVRDGKTDKPRIRAPGYWFAHGLQTPESYRGWLKSREFSPDNLLGDGGDPLQPVVDDPLDLRPESTHLKPGFREDLGACHMRLVDRVADL